MDSIFIPMLVGAFIGGVASAVTSAARARKDALPKPEIKVGSVVRLRSGGPKMTVLYASQHGPGWVCYRYLDGSHVRLDPPCPSEALEFIR